MKIILLILLLGAMLFSFTGCKSKLQRVEKKEDAKIQIEDSKDNDNEEASNKKDAPSDENNESETNKTSIENDTLKEIWEDYQEDGEAIILPVDEWE